MRVALCLSGLAFACSYPALPPLDDSVPAQLAFVGAPKSGTAQRPLETVSVAVKDAQGRIVQRATNEVTLSLGNNAGGAQLVGALSAVPVAGIASFRLVGVDRPGTGYTLAASSPDLAAATSQAFNAAALPFALITDGLSGGPASSVVVSPAPPGGTPTVYAAVANGVYRSTNSGASWTPTSFGLDEGGVGTLAADPKTPGLVYGVAGNHGGGTIYLVKKTIGQGTAWVEASDMATRFIQGATVAVDPVNPSILYVGGEKIRRSTDAGATWTVPGTLPFDCTLLAIDPITTSTLYCLAYDRAPGVTRGVFKSSDSGATWSAANTGLASLDTGLSDPVLVAAPTAVFVMAGDSLYRSTNSGGSWARVPIDLVFARALAYAPSVPSRMYLSRGFLGVAVSDDAGASFGEPVGVDDLIESLAVDPTNHNVVYAAGSRGVHVSINGGVRWTLSSNGIAAHNIESVAMAPGLPDTVVAATEDSVLRTTDGGASWTQAAAGNFEVARFDPAAPERAYLCGQSFSTSTNRGASFEAGATTGTTCSQFAFAGATVFAAGVSGLRKSINGGADWADTGLGATFAFGVALGDATGNVVVVATAKGIFRSSNGGATFVQVTSDHALALLADPAAPSHIIAGLGCGPTSEGAMSEGGIRVSIDGGMTFGTAVPGDCMFHLGDNGSALYALGVRTLSLSADHGATWTAHDTGIPPGLFANSIAASADGKTVYLGTTAGLYKSTTGGL